MDLINVIVDHIYKAKYEDLSKETVEVVKKLVIDTLGTTIAGSSADGIKTLVDLVKEWGGKEESTVSVYGGKAPAPNVALVNSTMARALDLDDVHEGGGGHVMANYLPAFLILAEYVQRPVSGKELILAIALGADLGCRLRCALTTYPGWTDETFAPFGIVAMGGKLLGFDKERMINGMGIAYSQCSTNIQALSDGALTARLQQGLGAKAGILATVLAERGITGAKNILQGAYGFYPLYARNEYNPEVITDQLGKHFEIVNTSIKPYPSGKCTHNSISASLALVKEYDISAADIEKIDVYINTNAYNMAVAGDNKYHPKNTADAQFNIPYGVATAVVRRKFFIDDLTEKSIRDSKVLELMQKIEAHVDPELDKFLHVQGYPVTPNTIEVKTKDGNNYSKRVEFTKGHPKNPMTMTECVEKFYHCARFSARALPQDKLEELVQLVYRLEEVDDMRRMVNLLVV